MRIYFSISLCQLAKPPVLMSDKESQSTRSSDLQRADFLIIADHSCNVNAWLGY